MIYVVTHKKFDDEKLNKNVYSVLHVGKNDNCKPDYQRDDAGDNIADKNPTFCELTGLYWIWKNVKEEPDEITGLVHYRRYFTDEAGFAEYKKSGKMPEVLLNKGYNAEGTDSTKEASGDILLGLGDNTIILPSRYKTLSTLYGSYKRCHEISDLDYLKTAMNSICPEYTKTFETVMNGHVGYYYNMFISTRRTLEKYCEWLFQILFEVERLKEADDEQRKSADAEGSAAEAKKADSSNTTYQDRLYGFLSERLLQVWVVHNGLTIKEYPVFNTEEPPVGFAKRNAIRIKYLWAKYVTHKDTEYIHKELN